MNKAKANAATTAIHGLSKYSCVDARTFMRLSQPLLEITREAGVTINAEPAMSVSLRESLVRILDAVEDLMVDTAFVEDATDRKVWWTCLPLYQELRTYLRNKGGAAE